MFDLRILDTEYISHSKKIAFCNMTVNFFKVKFKYNLEKKKMKWKGNNLQ